LQLFLPIVFILVVAFIFLVFLSSPPRNAEEAPPPGSGVVSNASLLHEDTSFPLPRSDQDLADDALRDLIIRRYSHISFMEKRQSSEDGGADILLPSVHVPPAMRRITGLDDASYVERVDLADAIKSLNSNELTALLYFLHKHSEHDKLSLLQFNAVKNQVVLALMRQKPFPQELVSHLVTMYYDDSLDRVWRDYCIQFLGQVYKNTSPTEHRRLVKNTIVDALKHKKDIAGSAIIALDALASCNAVNSSSIGDFAYKIAADPDASETVRAPALQIAAKYRHSAALQLARDILSSSGKESVSSSPSRNHGKSSIILQMSALAALGSAGKTADDLDVLKSHLSDSDIRLRTAARAACACVMLKKQ
jgi:hypothetical protein